MAQDLRRTAVVVEDDVFQRELIAMMLEESEFDVIQCESAETALLEINTNYPSFLVTDVNLSGRMDGVELAHRAREHHSELRIVVISGQQPARSLPDGVKFYLKPVHPTTLRREAAQ